MSKIAKSLCVALAMAAVGSVFAGQGNKMISFSTERDTYADGSPVLDGEWYALCWTGAETFQGLKTDCTPVNAEDRVVILASRAKDGCCPLTIFQIREEDGYNTGSFFVVVLDTRASATTLKAKGSNGLPQVNTTAVSASAKVAGLGGATATLAGVASSAYSLADGFTVENPARISAIEPDPAEMPGYVKITVSDVNPSLSYKVRYGKELTAIDSAVLEAEGVRGETPEEKFSATEVPFYIEKDAANFFTIDLNK